MSAPSRPAPPKPVPKPGRVIVVRALYKYIAQQPDELSFDEGDTLYIVDMATNNGWWKARCGDQIGLIPSNYVEENTEEITYPLHEAAKRGNLRFLKECLANKVSVNGLDKAGCTALHWAAHAGYEDCLLELFKIPGVQVSVQNKLGDSPLHSAAWKGHYSIVKILLDHGARPELINVDGRTAFDLATEPNTAALLKPFAKRCCLAEPDDYEESGESD